MSLLSKSTVTFDYRDIKKFEKTCKELGEKTALKAAKKAAQKGSNLLGAEIRKTAPKGETGNLRKGFKKRQEKSAVKGKYAFHYSTKSEMNDVFQKPVQHPGALGGKSKTAYYPASVEYGFLAKAKGSGYIFTPGKQYETQKVEGTDFLKNALENKASAIVEKTKAVLNEELDKAWTKK